MIRKFDKFLENAGATTSSPGSGTAVGGGAGSGDMGSFTSSAGQATYGGDSGTAFATNSNTAGMGAIKSSQPSDTPGDVAGSTPGSGDIGGIAFGTFTKTPAGKKKKRKKKKDRDYTKAGEHIDNFYTTKYTENFTNGNIVTSWKAFTEKFINESVETELILCGIDLDEKGRFGQKLTDIFLLTDEGYLKIGQLRKLETLNIFYPDFRSIESGNFTKHIIDDDMCRDLTVEEEKIVLDQLKRDKKISRNLMDDNVITYHDIIVDKLSKNFDSSWEK